MNPKLSDFIKRYGRKEVWKVEGFLVAVVENIVAEETEKLRKEKELLESMCDQAKKELADFKSSF